MFEDMSVFYDVQEYEGVFESMNEYISLVWVLWICQSKKKFLGRLYQIKWKNLWMRVIMGEYVVI